MQGLSAAQYRRHGLNGGAHNIVVRVFTGETDTGGLAMSAQQQRTGIFGRKLLFN